MQIFDIIKEYLYYRWLFLGMSFAEIMEYKVAHGSIAEYAQAHALNYSLTQLHVLKLFIAEQVTAAQCAISQVLPILPTYK